MNQVVLFDNLAKSSWCTSYMDRKNRSIPLIAKDMIINRSNHLGTEENWIK